uniref:ShKT domain-containing protein n=1 Tax=Haemonchus contortus TaxID=6289 RepID=A0A7I4YQV4_HAECO
MGTQLAVLECFRGIMSFHMLYFLLLLTIISTQSVMAKECADRAEEAVCAAHEDNGDCRRPEIELQMKLLCKKTCQLCA